MKHSCVGQPEKALIAHPWREDADGNWVRDDCVEQGVAFAAIVTQTLDGSQWCGPESGPYGDGPFYPTAKDAKLAFDIWLMQHKWYLV